MNIQLLSVPYDSGQYETRMGAGPTKFAEFGAARLLTEAGHPTALDVVTVERGDSTEIDFTFELHRQVAERVRSAVQEGLFPIVLSGNCGLAAVGSVTAFTDAPIGVIWFDAHGDFNTPETSPSGFLDGMSLSVVTGHSWTEQAQTIPHFRTVPENCVISAGARDLDPAEAEMMQTSEMCLITPERIGKVGLVKAIRPGLDYIGMNTRRVYLHIDLDCLDPAEAPANHYAVPNGLKVAELIGAIREISQHTTIVAAGLASYDPSVDLDGKTLRAGVEIMKVIAEVGKREA